MDPLLALIRDVPDFPKPGILFKDVTPLFGDGPGFREALGRMEAKARAFRPDAIVGIEARGFVLGAPLADRLGCGFIPVRKPGKLPTRSRRVDYGLEYGKDALEMHIDAFAAGKRLLIVDDVLATGGTAAAAAELVRGGEGAVAGFLFLIELTFLPGRARLGDAPVEAILPIG